MMADIKIIYQWYHCIIKNFSGCSSSHSNNVKYLYIIFIQLILTFKSDYFFLVGIGVDLS